MKYLKWIVALAVSGAGLWFALHKVKWREVVAAVSHLRRPAWLLTYLGVVGLIFLARSVRWKMFLSRLAPRSGVWEFFPITAGGFFLNNILPFRAGELARVFWTNRKIGVSVGSLVSVLALERFFDMLTLLTFLLLVLGKNPNILPSMAILWGLSAVSAGFLAGLVVLTHYPSAVTGSRWFQKLPQAVRNFILHVIEGVSALKSRTTLLAIYVLSCAFWAADIAFIQLAGHVFSLPLSWLDAAWLMCGLCLGASLPSAPGYVGTLEASGVAALQVLGYEPTAVFPFILVLHLTQMASTVFWGLPSALYLGAAGPAGLTLKGAPSDSVALARPAK